MINTQRIEKILSSLGDENFDKTEILNITDAKELYTLIYCYNWDDGFKLPAIILQNPNCDITVALMIFHLADGYTVLSKNYQFDSNDYEVWVEFMLNLKKMFLDGVFKESKIMFKLPYNEEQISYLKEKCPEFAPMFLVEIEGEEFEPPYIEFC